MQCFRLSCLSCSQTMRFAYPERCQLSAGCANQAVACTVRESLGSVPDVHGEHPPAGGGRRGRQQMVQPNMQFLCSMLIIIVYNLAYYCRSAEQCLCYKCRSTYCREAFMDNFAYSNRTMSMLLGCGQVRTLF